MEIQFSSGIEEVTKSEYDAIKSLCPIEDAASHDFARKYYELSLEAKLLKVAMVKDWANKHNIKAYMDSINVSNDYILEQVEQIVLDHLKSSITNRVSKIEQLLKENYTLINQRQVNLDSKSHNDKGRKFNIVTIISTIILGVSTIVSGFYSSNLKSEIAEKDKKISELQKIVDFLPSLQKEVSSEDKLIETLERNAKLLKKKASVKGKPSKPHKK